MASIVRPRVAHVLNGDAMLSLFKESGIEGSVFCMREAFAQGEIKGDTIDEVLMHRKTYYDTHGKRDHPDYEKYVIAHFHELRAIPNDTKIYLWFGYDVFCQVNLWFVLTLLLSKDFNLYLVYPTHLEFERRNEDFGSATVDDLRDCFENVIEISEDDKELADTLWQAFRDRNIEELTVLEQASSNAFPDLDETIQRIISYLDGSLKEVVKEIYIKNQGNFEMTFSIFMKEYGMYGFSDDMVREMV